MSEDIQCKIPLGLCKQAVMKLDSFITDVHEIKEDADLDPEDKQIFEQIAEISGSIMAAIVHMVSKELGEEQFLSEDFIMDDMDKYSEE